MNKNKETKPEKVTLNIKAKTAVWLQQVLSKSQVQGPPEGLRQWLASYDEVMAQLDAPEKASDEA